MPGSGTFNRGWPLSLTVHRKGVAVITQEYRHKRTQFPHAELCSATQSVRLLAREQVKAEKPARG
jgi:hypothetical protein